eukprot:7100883-Prymnesium_polylepis.2
MLQVGRPHATMNATWCMQTYFPGSWVLMTPTRHGHPPHLPHTQRSAVSTSRRQARLDSRMPPAAVCRALAPLKAGARAARRQRRC